MPVTKYLPLPWYFIFRSRGRHTYKMKSLQWHGHRRAWRRALKFALIMREHVPSAAPNIGILRNRIYAVSITYMVTINDIRECSAQYRV